MEIKATDIDESAAYFLDMVRQDILILDPIKGKVYRRRTTGLREYTGKNLILNGYYISKAKLMYLVFKGNVPKDKFVTVLKDEDLEYLDRLVPMNHSEISNTFNIRKVAKNAPFTEQQVIDYRRQLVETRQFPVAEVAKINNTDPRNIYYMLTGRTYKMVPGAIDSKLLTGSYHHPVLRYTEDLPASEKKRKGTSRAGTKHSGRFYRVKKTKIDYSLDSPNDTAPGPVKNMSRELGVNDIDCHASPVRENKWRTIGEKLKNRH